MTTILTFTIRTHTHTPPPDTSGIKANLEKSFWFSSLSLGKAPTTRALLNVIYYSEQCYQKEGCGKSIGADVL